MNNKYFENQNKLAQEGQKYTTLIVLTVLMLIVSLLIMIFVVIPFLMLGGFAIMVLSDPNIPHNSFLTVFLTFFVTPILCVALPIIIFTPLLVIFTKKRKKYF